MSNKIYITQKRVQVTTSGIPAVLSGTPLKTPSCLIVADPSNTGTIYVGDADVDATTRLGVPIVAGDDLELDATKYFGTSEILDLNLFYVDSTANGDYVIISYYKREGD